MLIKRLLIITCTILFVDACSNVNPTSPNESESEMTANFQLFMMNTPLEVAFVIGELSRDSYQTITESFTVQNDTTMGFFSNVPVGIWTLSITAYADDSTALYYGSSAVSIEPNVLNVIHLTLDPVTGDLIVYIDWGNGIQSPFIIYSRLSNDDWHDHQGVYKIDLETNQEVHFIGEAFYGSISHSNLNYYYRETYYSSNVWYSNILTSQQWPLTEYPHIYNWPRVSNDATKLVWNEGASLDYQVYFKDFVSYDIYPLDSCVGYSVFSPHNNEILNRGILFNLGGQVVDTLFTIPDVDWDVFMNEYSSDGQWIAILAQTPPYVDVGPARTDTKVYIYNTNSNLLYEITPELTDSNYIRSVDFVELESGPHVIFTTPSQIGIMDTDGSNVEVIKELEEGSDYHFAWTSGSH